ncbi:hypothetical protein L2Y94_01865 [Luteibacter aegosomatis]|uniref:hypothetical protein n=1 Tax=Luteibacter aegosomatis TaxID=2911537 RepID=UPI001FF7B07E|nr:hypothetical protein [Luteibacter aegosomatis]UPG86136.1 hypothetical protein L2Y94_01865 [Luteibacter aegosomatis]
MHHPSLVRRGLTIACAVALAGCASHGIRLAASPVHPQSFDGHWVVDTSRSEDPDAVATGSGGGHGGMGRGHGHGGGGGMGGMSGMGGRHGGAGDGADIRANAGGGSGDVMRRALLLPDTLDITLQPDTLQIAPDGHMRSIAMVTGKDNGGDTTRAGWDGDSLVVITHLDDKRGDIVQRYDMSPDRSRLTVTTEFKRRSKDVSVVREFTSKVIPAAQAVPSS